MTRAARRADSIDARDKLVELGKEVELILYQDEGHSFLKIENVIDSEDKTSGVFGESVGVNSFELLRRTIAYVGTNWLLATT